GPSPCPGHCVLEPDTTGVLQGSRVCCVCRRTAADRHQQDTTRRAEEAGPRLTGHPLVHGYPQHEKTPGTHRMTASRLGYDGIVATVPVTIPYVRYSIESAHWWLGTALGALIRQAGIAKQQVDGLCVSSFTLAPDTAVGLTQHLGMSPRWLDHIPMGGASGVIGLRRAARAVQAGDAGIVACLAGDTNHVDSFRHTVSQFSRFAQDGVYPYGAGGPNASFALLTRHYMRTTGATREDFGRLCVAQRENALRNPHALMKKPLSLEQYLAAREITAPIHLFDCVMPCAGA